MPLTPDQPFPKKQGDNIRSKDWNDAVNELIRLDAAKLTLASGGALSGPLSVSTPVTVTPSLTLRQNLPTWSNADLYKDFRFIRTEFAGSPADGPFRQFNVGAGGVSIGYANVPTLTSPHALYVNGNVGIGTNDPSNAKLVIGGVTAWNTGIGVTGNASGGAGIYLESTVTNGHKYSLFSGAAGTGVGTGGFALYDDTALAYRLAVDSSGQVGIGTPNPDRALTVQGGGGAYLNVKTTSGLQEILVGADAGGGIVSVMTNHDLQLRAGGNNTKVWIKTNGAVGVGASAPATQLAVGGNGVNLYATDVWVENNMHVQGNETLAAGGRGRLRLGTAWTYIGVYAEHSSTGKTNDLILGASSNVVRVGPPGGGQSLAIGDWTIYVEGDGLVFKRGDSVVARFSTGQDRLQIYQNVNGAKPYWYYNKQNVAGTYS